MSLVNLSVRHGRTLDDARQRLEQVVAEVQKNLGAVVHQTEWSADRSSARLAGIGFEARLSVDVQEVHVAIDVPLLGNILASPVVARLKEVVQDKFQKRLE